MIIISGSARGINCFTIYDEDAQFNIQRSLSLLGSSNVFIQKPTKLEGMLGIAGHLDKSRSLRELPLWFENHPNPQIYKDMTEQIKAF